MGLGATNSSRHAAEVRPRVTATWHPYFPPTGPWQCCLACMQFFAARKVPAKCLPQALKLCVVTWGHQPWLRRLLLDGLHCWGAAAAPPAALAAPASSTSPSCSSKTAAPSCTAAGACMDAAASSRAAATPLALPLTAGSGWPDLAAAVLLPAALSAAASSCSSAAAALAAALSSLAAAAVSAAASAAALAAAALAAALAAARVGGASIM